MTNFTCDKCNTRVPRNRPILFCSMCDDFKHYKCHNLSKNEAYEIIVNGHTSNWTCNDCMPFIYFDEPSPDRPTIRQNTALSPCPACNKQCSPDNSFKTSVCTWCDRPCHNKCNKGVLGCLACCNEIIPGYICESYELNSSLFRNNNTAVFDPYDGESLINQIGNRIDNEEETPIWAEISEKLKKCRYTEPINVTASKSNELKILSHNVRSLSKNIGYLRENIDHYSKFDVLCFCETSCDVDTLPNNIDDITLDGFYNPFISKPARASNKGGGLAIYVNKRVCDETDLEMLDLGFENNSTLPPCEFQLLKVNIGMANGHQKKSYIISNFYRSPSTKPKLFIDYLEDILNKLDRHSKKQIILGGDFNIDLTKYGTDEISRLLVDLTTRHGFVQVINRPTRITDHSATLIDHIYTNQVHNMITSGVITYDFSDHLGTYVTISLDDDICTRDSDDNYEFAKFNDENLATFKTLIHDHCWDDVLNETDTQLKYDKFISEYTEMYNSAFPKTNARRKHQRTNPKPWILPWLEEACHRKNLAYFKFVHEPTTENETNYENLKAFANKHTKIAKRKYYKRYFEQYSSNSRKQWQMLNNLLNRKTRKSAPIKLKDDNGNVTSDPKTVAETFNVYFTTIADKLKKNIRVSSETDTDTDSSTDYTDTLTDSVLNSIYLEHTSPTEIENHINSLKNKATSDTNVSALKAASSISDFNIVLSDIINSSFDNGIFPSQLKIAKVVPIHKGGSKTDVSNYRPISLLSIFSKLFEKAMHIRVYDFLQNNGSLNDHQFGFRKQRSCEHALLTAQKELLDALSKKQIALLLLIDFSKAFDMVDHDILLHKLHHYGIRGVANDWFKSYLKNRSQYVYISGKSSSRKNLKYSVPQGSILGPLLFIIYINDLPNISNLAKFILYADDANIIITGETLAEIESSFNHLSKSLIKWVRNNELMLNIKKTNYMIFTNRRNLDFSSFVPKMGKTPIERKKVAKFLGVLVDDKLSWKQHITAIRSKMSRYIGVLYKLKHILPLQARMLTFNSLVQSHLNYCSLIWGTTNKTKIESLFTTQKKAMRSIMPGLVNYFYKKGEFPTHTKPAFTELNVATVHNIILKNVLIFLNKVHNFPHLLPSSVRQTISPDSPSPSSETDYTSDWYSTHNRSPYNTSIFFKGPLLYTSITADRNRGYDNVLFENPNRYKNNIRSYLQDVQCSGDSNDWTSDNFKLYSVVGLRRSDRIRTQPAVNYRE